MSLLYFIRKVALSLLKSAELFKKRSDTERPSKLYMQRSLHVERGHLIFKSEDNRRQLCKQCHSQTVCRCKMYDVALHHGCSESFHA